MTYHKVSTFLQEAKFYGLAALTLGCPLFLGGLLATTFFMNERHPVNPVPSPTPSRPSMCLNLDGEWFATTEVKIERPNGVVETEGPKRANLSIQQIDAYGVVLGVMGRLNERCDRLIFETSTRRVNKAAATIENSKTTGAFTEEGGSLVIESSIVDTLTGAALPNTEERVIVTVSEMERVL